MLQVIHLLLCQLHLQIRYLLKFHYGKVKLKIPGGIKSGQVLRLRGKGMQELNRNRFGDQLVRVNIETPKKVSKKAKKLMEELSSELSSEVNFEKFS